MRILALVAVLAGNAAAQSYTGAAKAQTVTATSSVTASAFFGDISNTTGGPSAASVAALNISTQANAVAIATTGAVVSALGISTQASAATIQANAVAIATTGAVVASLGVSTNTSAATIQANGVAIATTGAVVAALGVSTNANAANLTAAFASVVSSGIVFGSASGAITTNQSFLTWDNVNHRLGIRTANPAHGLDCSSCTLYLDGNAGNPIQVGTNGSTMTLTSAGAITIPSTMTALSFVGSLSSATNYTVSVASYAASSVSVANVNYVGVATETVTLRGGRPLVINASTNLFNEAGGNRTYDCEVVENGTTVLQNPRTLWLNGGFQGIMSIPVFVASSPSGSNTFALFCKTSNATAAQVAGTTLILVQEF